MTTGYEAVRARLQIGLNIVSLRFSARQKGIDMHTFKGTVKRQVVAATGVGHTSGANTAAEEQPRCHMALSDAYAHYPAWHTARVCRDPSDISVAYYFNALLHLATEGAVRLSNTSEGDLDIECLAAAVEGPANPDFRAFGQRPAQ